MLQQGSGFHIALFSTIPWCLWQQRNRLREHQPSWPLHEIGARAKDLVRWSPPPEHCNIQCNVVWELGLCWNWVGVPRSCREFIVALSQKIAMVQSVKLTEVFAARRSMVFAKKLSLFQVMIRGIVYGLFRLWITQADVTLYMTMLLRKLKV